MHHNSLRRIGWTAGTAVVAVAVVTGCTAVEAATPTLAGPSVPAAATSPQASSDTVAALHTDAQAVIDANADQTVVNVDEWSSQDAKRIELAGTTGSSEAAGVDISAGIVTVTEAGVYELVGTWDGTVVVAAPDDALVVLMLNGIEILAQNAPAIQVDAADDVAIHLVDGSNNVVTSTGAYVEGADANAALWSNQDLTVAGAGTLEVGGEVNDGITSEDDLVILAGNITVTAADDGLRGKDSLTVRGGTVTVDAGGDGLTSDNADEADRGFVLVEAGTLNITAGSDGIDGFTDVVLNDGSITLAAAEGIEAGTIVISGGAVSVTASDDGINGAAGSAAESDEPAQGPGQMQDTGEVVLIAGGTVAVAAMGDGFDSNGTITMTGGTVIVQGPTQSGNGALDANGAIAVSGGSLVALGAGSMEQTPTTDSQGWLASRVQVQRGQTIEVIDQQGAVVTNLTASANYGWILASAAGVTMGDTYQLVIDGTSIATATAGAATGDGR